MSKSRTTPDFFYEQSLWQKGFIVAGADEVGRGAFAGPIVAAAVSFSPNIKLEVEINDSKLLTPRKREEASLWIKQYALLWGVGEGSVSRVNRLGIVKATQFAFRRALNHQPLIINHLLIDAFYIPHVRGLPKVSQTPIIKGDRQSLSIAAASIIAKVHRDQIMCDLALKKYYRIFHWEMNKGYGTRLHREALEKHGLTRYHREKFITKYLNNFSSFPSRSET